MIANELISVVVPLYNEAENVQPLLERIRTALTALRYELILVDDGSRDATVRQVRQYADAQTKLVVLARNYGQTAAMAAGIDAAQGDYIVTLDGDLQNDPADIPAMHQLAQTGDWDVVAGNRANRQDGLLLRKLPSRLANALIRRLTGVYIDDYGCTLKLFRRDIAKNLGLYGDMHRFIPPLAVLQGARITQMNVRHHPRLHGASKYGLGRIGPVLSDLLLVLFWQRYFRRPMRLFGPLAAVSLLAGAGVSIYLLIQKLMGATLGGNSLLLLAAVLLLGGFQLLAFGLIAEMQMRTYHESAHKPTYRVREIIEAE
ncbi:glycosyltransferase family 2 protein [Spirosoma taeanense]|uniref:Glycosyltransferase family 2 protein n=1 Tax=Spirosoma taeanense TaxID=2735870 RepID=A0A6M5Y688_9BACT|nr:glycosyltransferase family 2 protein [Spirosoma taeanense]QJW89937.1 glycosyltransferase family 2 protein [Spirosoma taeanense]